MGSLQGTLFSAEAPTSAPSLSAWVNEPRPALSEATRRDIKAWRAASEVFRRYFRGQSVSSGADDGPLNDCLACLQRVLSHDDLSRAVREQLQYDLGTTLRLLHYATAVGPRFQAQYQEQLAQGFATLKLTAPDFAALDRGQAIAQTDTFNTRLVAAMNAHHERNLLAAYNVRELLTGLRHLWPRLIPAAWLPSEPPR
ncbi:MAG: hypothetical protein K1X64_22165, partial [Myxococcaceae bacterium]|nr:hypothetical protein [Myxococcaceae bacterium]